MHNVLIPALGESITEGVISKWLVADGASVAENTPIFELETDKITSEGTAEAAGVITLTAAAGDEVKIGQTVATIDSAATAAAPTPAPETPKSAAKESTASPAVRPSRAAPSAVLYEMMWRSGSPSQAPRMV